MQLGDWATWATDVFAAMALVLSFLAHREARESRKSNEKWQQVNADAAVRSANAAEKAIALQEKSLEASNGSLPGPVVLWRLERNGNLFVLRNIGSAVATGVTVDETQIEAMTRELPKDAAVRPGASVDFFMVGVLGGPMPNEIWLTWDGTDEPVAVPVPRG